MYMYTASLQVDRRKGGRTALHCASVSKNTELIKLLLEFGANREAEASVHSSHDHSSFTLPVCVCV
jgi:ankyrin repeat protein